MNSAVCTLFEGHYHFGLGALANSLYAHGFRGTIYAGYRGTLPPWAGKSKMQDSYTDFSPAEGLTLRFIPLATKIHLTNYKPDFILQVLETHCPDAEAMFYFDPDITIKCRWTFFEEWINGGVALCEDVNSPMPTSHPIRNAWRHYYAKFGRTLPNTLDTYVNGGFVGISLKHLRFIEDWQQIQQEMSAAAGDLMGWGLGDRTFEFCFTDQDALNINLMNTTLPSSLSGKDGMDIERMGYIMSHAVGSPKPWKKRYMSSVLKGIKPSTADKGFWSKASTPIKLYSSHIVMLHQKSIRIASLVGRFYSQ